MRSLLFSLLIMSICVVSCKKKESEERGIPPNEASIKDLNETSSTENATFADTKNEKLFANYLEIKKALVNSDAQAVKKAARNFSDSFKTDSTYTSTRQVAVLISREDDLAKQREFFVGLTDEVTSRLKNDIQEGKLFKQFCPMAFEGKGGYWLSNSKEIRNPYFGDQMLKCGEVTETIQ